MTTPLVICLAIALFLLILIDAITYQHPADPYTTREATDHHHDDPPLPPHPLDNPLPPRSHPPRKEIE